MVRFLLAVFLTLPPLLLNQSIASAASSTQQAESFVSWSTWWRYASRDVLEQRAREERKATGENRTLTIEERRRVLVVLRQNTAATEPTLRRAALIALGRSREIASEPLLFRALGDKDASVQQAAVVALGFMGRDSVRQLLTALFLDQPEGRKRSGTTVPVDPVLRGLAALSLAHSTRTLGAERRKEIDGTLVSFSDQARRAGDMTFSGYLAALGEIGGAKARAALVNIVGDDTLEAARLKEALTSLGRIGDKTSVRPLLRLLRHENSGVRRGAVFALGACAPAEDAKVAQILRRLTHDRRDLGIRGGAVIALGTIGGSENLAFLQQLLLSGSSHTRCFAALALGHALKTCKDNGAPAQTTATMRSLIKSSKNPEIRASCALALGLIGDRKAVPILLRILKRGASADLRGKACLALGLLKCQEAAELLRDTAFDRGDVLMREDAFTALGLFPNNQNTTFLVEQLESPETVTSLWHPKALAMTRHRLSAHLSLLLTAAHSDSKNVDTAVIHRRVLATTALASLVANRSADEDLRPWQGEYGIESPLLSLMSRLF